jgi:hypothetical protein
VIAVNAIRKVAARSSSRDFIAVVKSDRSCSFKSIRSP